MHTSIGGRNGFETRLLIQYSTQDSELGYSLFPVQYSKSPIQDFLFRRWLGLTRHVHVHDKLYRLLMRGRYKEERLERRKTVPAGRVGNEEGMEISRPGKWSGWGDSRGSVSAGS